MSKLSVRGTAELVFPVDIFRISTTIRSIAPASGEALSSGKLKTEQFLALMRDKLKIQPESFKLEHDTVTENYSVQNTYIYTKRLSVDMNADLAVFSELTSLMEDLTDTLYDVEFALSDEAEKEKQVISAAIANSRDKAEFIASSLGKSIKGVDEVSYEQPTSDLYRCLAKTADGMNCNSLESMIKLPTKMISKTIDIDWIID